MEFRDIDPAYFRAPATFQFISQFVSKVEQNYRANPSLFDFDFSPLNVGIKPVRYGSPTSHNQTPHKHPHQPNRQKSNRPCILYSDRGFKSNHFSLNYKCGVAKLQSAEILQMISFHKLCPSCASVHDTSFQCILKYHDGTSKVCIKGCKLNRIPIHGAA